MTFDFAAAWAAAWASLLFLIFMLDMTAGPFALRWMSSLAWALAFGAVLSVVMIGPMVWVSVTR